MWALLPCLLAWLVFALAQGEHLRIRYFAYSAAPLAVLAMLAIEEGISVASRVAGRGLLRHYVRSRSLLYVIVLTAVLFLQGAQTAARTEKEPYSRDGRGNP